MGMSCIATNRVDLRRRGRESDRGVGKSKGRCPAVVCRGEGGTNDSGQMAAMADQNLGLFTEWLSVSVNQGHATHRLIMELIYLFFPFR